MLDLLALSATALVAATPMQKDTPAASNLVQHGAVPGLSATKVDLDVPPSDLGGYCDPGYYQCGIEHCTPEGGVCCASVGREDRYCGESAMNEMSHAVVVQYTFVPSIANELRGNCREVLRRPPLRAAVCSTRRHDHE